MPASHSRCLSSLAVLALSAAGAFANERHFSYTYETAVLAPGAKELEVWTTARGMRESYYSAIDNRVEFEVGVCNNLMTAFYINWRNETVRVPGAGLASGFSYQGISSEWKWKLMDPVANAVGLALYAELGYNTDEIEIESKVLLDKKLGKWLLAYNLVGELEVEAEGEEDGASIEAEFEPEEIVIENDIGLSYPITNRFHAGLELRNVNECPKNAAGDFELEAMALFLGPVVSYATESWWMSFTLLPQLPALYKEEEGSSFVVDGLEYLNARLLFSFHI